MTSAKGDSWISFHQDWGRTVAVNGPVVAETTMVTISPAVGFRVEVESAGVIAANGDASEVSASGNSTLGDGDGSGRIKGGAIAELTMIITSPTISLAVRTEGAGVIITSRNVCYINTIRNITLGDSDWSGGISSGIIAKLTRDTKTPTISFIIRTESTGVVFIS